MKNKLAIVPVLLLSSAFMLTACSPAENQVSAPTQASVSPLDAPTGSTNTAPTSAPAPSASAAPTFISGYVAPPQELPANYKQFFRPFSTTDPRLLATAQSMGATTSHEDPAQRPMTVSEYEALKTSTTQHQALVKTNWEIQSDYETTAQNVSDALAKNANATLDDLKANKALIVNRYSNVGSVSIEQDSTTKFFFVVFRVNDQNFKGVPMGILVPQAGKTPDFQHTAGPDSTNTK